MELPRRRSVKISAIPTRLCVNDFDTLVSAALAEAGLVRVPSWQRVGRLSAQIWSLKVLKCPLDT